MVLLTKERRLVINSMKEIIEKITDIYNNKFINNIIVIIIYIIIAIVVFKLFKRIIKRAYNRKIEESHKAQYHTVLQMFLSMGKIIIMILLSLAVLAKIGVNVSKLVAGLGVASLVIGLALQDLFKDIISGISIILDDYFIIGDVVQYGDFKGEVSSIGIKSVKIKRFTGEVLIINNRDINKVVNYSKNDTVAPLEFYISLTENPDKVISMVEKTLKNYKCSEDVIDKPICLGISNNDKNSYIVRIHFTTKPEAHYAEGRRIRQAIIEDLQRANIKQPLEIINKDQ